MDEFYVEISADETGAHMVHKDCCPNLPGRDMLRWIGVRSNTAAPLREAANWFSKSTPCPKCIVA